MIVGQILLVRIIGNVWKKIGRICKLILGCRGLTSIFFYVPQIKLLLQQQNAQLLPTPNALLTPPRSPHLESCHGNDRSPNSSPISMVTACTNTGASLLFGTPLKFNGKKSAATSPIKEKDLNLSRRSVQKVELIQIIFFSLSIIHLQYAQIFVCGHNLYQDVNRFSENYKIPLCPSFV